MHNTDPLPLSIASYHHTLIGGPGDAKKKQKIRRGKDSIFRILRYPLSDLPISKCLSVLDPVDQLVSGDLGALLFALNLDLLPIFEFPLLLFDGDETRLEFVPAKNDGEWDFVLLPSCELGWQLRLVLEREFGLVMSAARRLAYGQPRGTVGTDVYPSFSESLGELYPFLQQTVSSGHDVHHRALTPHPSLDPPWPKDREYPVQAHADSDTRDRWRLLTLPRSGRQEHTHQVVVTSSSSNGPNANLGFVDLLLALFVDPLLGLLLGIWFRGWCRVCAFWGGCRCRGVCLFEAGGSRGLNDGFVDDTGVVIETTSERHVK